RKFTCPWQGCGSTFTRKFNLNSHIRRHQGERPFCCSWYECGKLFTRRSDCKRHERLHTNGKAFQYLRCGTAFSRRDTLLTHGKSKSTMHLKRPSYINSPFHT
ncbi:hypothetical protein R3P38DRAFT_2512688, partial [Favolaschia claudopus]